MKNSKKYISGKSIFITASLAISVTVLIIYITGLPSHRTVLENSILSLTILAMAFFLFLTIGLYNGLHIHDDLSRKLKIVWGKPKAPNLNSGAIPDGPDFTDVGEGLAGILISIALWIAMTILFILFLIFLEFVLWAGAIGFVALIYWILMRALKLVFSKSQECQNDLPKSVVYRMGYTMLYVGWVYGVIYISALF